MLSLADPRRKLHPSEERAAPAHCRQCDAPVASLVMLELPLGLGIVERILCIDNG
jgi:hypothetical protein